jgi:glutaredoxin 3
MKQHHTIEIFSANCPLCKHITDDIQIGKCEGCSQTIYDVNKMTEDVKSKMKKYGVKAVPTTVIDGEIEWLVSQISRGYVETNCIPN